LEVVFGQESMYFVVVILFVNDDCGLVFVGLGNHCVVLTEFVVDVFCDMCLSLVCAVSVAVSAMQNTAI
jgi:hypothetical protein